MSDPAIARPLERRAGVLLHITSLAGTGPVGDLDDALACVGPLAEAGLGLWQILPTCPTDSLGSPYSSWSNLSGNPLLIGLQPLVEYGLLPVEVLTSAPPSSRPDHADLGLAKRWKLPLLEQAAARLVTDPGHTLHQPWQEHREAHPWTAEAGLFWALREAQHGAPWWCWPSPHRNREPEAVDASRAHLRERIDIWTALEFFFDRQFSQLREQCAGHGIELVGDLPIYVGDDSVDVWSEPGLFQLDEDRRPTAVSGCPPDALNELGQWWGTPLYRWEWLAADNFSWWTRRVQRSLQRTHWLRIDHFIALVNYWSIPTHAADARAGSWQPGPGAAVLRALAAELGPLPLVAEDLGVLGEEVVQVRDELQIPGMVVLPFGFDGSPDNPHHPHNHRANSLCCTGTHDTPTLARWWQQAAEPVRDRVHRALAESDTGHASRTAPPGALDEPQIVRQLVDLCLASPASWAIVPVQDLLGLGAQGRMNTPGTTSGNWTWRLQAGELSRALEGLSDRVLEHRRKGAERFDD